MSLEIGLIDDSEEVRETAALSVSHILSQKLFWIIPRSFRLGTWSLEPVQAHKALTIMLTAFDRSDRANAQVQKQLAKRVTLAILGVCPPQLIDDRRVSQTDSLIVTEMPDVLLHQASMQDDTVLFEEERPNLYVNEVARSESLVWVLIQLLRSFEELDWAVKGVQTWLAGALIALERYIESKPNSPLSVPSSRPVWVFGMRVLILVRAFVQQRRSIRTDTTNLVDGLKRLQKLSQEVELNQEWAEEIGRGLGAWADK
jgi:hypothetical protein